MEISNIEKTSSIAIVILSCDKFLITWKPCVDHFFNAWPDCPYPVYLLNNLVPSNDGRVMDLLVGEDLNWSDSLIKGLLKIEERRVFFIYDDSFLSYINVSVVQEIFCLAVKDNLESVTLRKNPFDRGTRYNDYLVKLRKETKYRNALFLNLFDKNILLNLLRSGEDAWQFEKDGNRRSEDICFYSVKTTNLATYHHGIVKGKWLPRTKKYLVRKGYDFDGSTIKSYSYIESFGMDLYARIFVMGNKVINKILLYRE